jgi:hypothetical protein
MKMREFYFEIKFTSVANLGCEKVTDFRRSDAEHLLK